MSIQGSLTRGLAATLLLLGSPLHAQSAPPADTPTSTGWQGDSSPSAPGGDAPSPTTAADAPPVAAPAPGIPDAATDAMDAMDAPEPPVAAPASKKPICLVGIGRGDANAETATALICEKLRERGVEAVTVDQAVPAPAVYRVNLRPLGTLYYLELVREEPAGHVVASRRLQLGGLEQVPVAAERLVVALTEDRPVEETATARSLVDGETRKPAVRSNDVRFAFGVVGVMVGSDVGYGADMAFGFHGQEYGAQIRGRAAGGDASHVSLAVSGWRYFGDGDVAPFVGVGFGLGRLTDDDGFAGNGLLVEPTIGLELFRFDQSRLLITTQLDIPVFRFEKTRNLDGERQLEERFRLGGSLATTFVF